MSAAVAVVMLLAVVACPHSARAQGGSRVLPADVYYQAFAVYNAGEYRDALRAFRDVARTGLIDVSGRWVDSICYNTMMGECHYRMGELGPALEYYDAAVKLYLAYSNWLLNVQFPDTITPSSSSVRSRINWGVSQRGAKLGQYPDTMSAMFGRINNEDVVRGGGVIDPARFRPVRAQEIVRCTALAMRRRSEIMGPTCEHDPTTANLLTALSTRPAPPNHWSQAWIDTLLGLAYVSAGRQPEAIKLLERSLLVGGLYDHALTGAALLELGKLAFQQGKFDVASTYFLEATLATAQFEQFDDMEEAFRYGATAYIMAGGKGVYPPLGPAGNWANTNGTRPLQASLLVSAAECSLAQGQAATAANFLSDAQRFMSRNDLSTSDIGTRYQYQLAHASFQQGNTAGGTSNLAAAMALQRNNSAWLFQIALADKLYTSGGISPRLADRLFSDLLREPAAEDWKLKPAETMGVVTTPHVGPLEHWFEVMLVARKDPVKALDIADRIRRHRFFTTMPMGGRLTALRWILEAPDEALTNSAILQRQNLLVNYPAYAELSRQARAARTALRRLPLAPVKDAERKEREKLLVELAKLSAAQDTLLSDIALRREASEFVFPPLRTVKEIQADMPDRQLTLAFFNTSRGAFVFLLTKDELNVQQIAEAVKVRRELINLLRKMGHYDKNHVIGLSEVRDESWRESARELMKLLVDERELGTDFWSDFDELVIVPDGLTWYVPFEALQIPHGDATVSIMSRMRVRYAPTLSLTVPDRRNRRPAPNVAVVTGKMFPRDDAEVALYAFDDLRRSVPRAAKFDDQLPAPSSLLKTMFDQLVVLDEIDDNVNGPYDWSPMQVDRGKPGSALSAWFALPWGGPDQVVVPGFQTAAADSLKRGGAGDEIFLTVCGMMATGTRTILISRWRTGGQTSFDLTREFVDQLSQMPASSAWRRSVQLAMAGDLDPEFEPRFKASGLDEFLNPDHPFFWAGYMLVDTGSQPKTEADE